MLLYVCPPEEQSLEYVLCLACRTSRVWKTTTAPIFFRKLQFLTSFFIAILICLNMTDVFMSQGYLSTRLELYLLYTFAAVFLHIFTTEGSTGETSMSSQRQPGLHGSKATKTRWRKCRKKLSRWWQD
jgi:hypothetical protein